jgi:hypothetical protein
MNAPLTPEEASAAADCVAAMLEDFANLDEQCPISPLIVYAGPAPDHQSSAPIDMLATRDRVAAARAALVKLREVAE